MLKCWQVGKTSRITDYGALIGILNIGSIQTLRELRKGWVEEALARGEMGREGKWTESVAVGSRDFVETVRTRLGIRVKGRRVSGMEDDCTLREPQGQLGVRS